MKPSFLIKKVRADKKKENLEHFSAKSISYDVEEVKDINYLNDRSEFHTMDIYGPKDSQEYLPVIVMIHGGGYISCDKYINEYQGKYFASKGVRVVNMNYRLQPEASFIEGVEDVFAVLRWIVEHADECKFDTNQICVYGDSAGGHYALLTTAVQNSDYLQQYYGIRPLKEGIKGVTVSCPMYEIRSAKEKKDITSLFLRMSTLHSGRIKDDTYIDNVSVPSIIDRCGFPEFFLITTPTDDVLYKEVSELHRLLEEKQVKHTYKEYSSTERVLGHVFHAVDPEYPESMHANDDILNYFLTK